MRAKFLSFIGDAILALIASLLWRPLEILNVIVVAVKYGAGVFDYFRHTGYEMDVLSASRHRSLWNFLLLSKKASDRFTEGTDMSISAYLGVNAMNRGLTWFGWILYRILYIIDRKNRKNQGHCISAYNLYLSKHIDQGQS